MRFVITVSTTTRGGACRMTKTWSTAYWDKNGTTTCTLIIPPAPNQTGALSPPRPMLRVEADVGRQLPARRISYDRIQPGLAVSPRDDAPRQLIVAEQV